jgi:hypothetical protein
VIRLLEQASVRMIVVDRRVTRFRHQRQMENVIAAHPDRFDLVQELPLRRGRGDAARGLAVYELLPGPDWTPSDRAQIRQVPGYDGVEAR